jgi:hypothetical protein
VSCHAICYIIINILEDLVASIFKMELKMEAAGYSETLVTVYQIAYHHTPVAATFTSNRRFVLDNI